MTVEPEKPLDGNWPTVGSVPVSVLIPVKNEEPNIGPCLQHVRWAEQLVVVDSQSSDRTGAIAESMGISVAAFNSRLNRARKDLKRILGQMEAGPDGR